VPVELSHCPAFPFCCGQSPSTQQAAQPVVHFLSDPQVKPQPASPVQVAVPPLGTTQALHIPPQ
jgi:hypothetical protein